MTSDELASAHGLERRSPASWWSCPTGCRPNTRSAIRPEGSGSCGTRRSSWGSHGRSGAAWTSSASPAPSPHGQRAPHRLGRCPDPHRSRLTLTAFVVVTCTLVGAHDQTKSAPASGECPAGLPSSIRRAKSVKQRHGEIHLDELSGKAQLGNAQERAGGGERRPKGRLGEPTPRCSENLPLVAPHVDH